MKEAKSSLAGLVCLVPLATAGLAVAQSDVGVAPHLLSRVDPAPWHASRLEREIPVVEGFAPQRARLGLAASLLNSDSDLDDSTTFRLDAEFGFRVNREASVQLEIGGLVGLSYFESGTTDITGAYLGPQARVYFNARNKVQPWVGLAVAATSTSISTALADDSYSGSFVRFGGGVSIFTSGRVAFEVSLEQSATDSDLYNDPLEQTLLKFGISTFF